MRNCLNGPSPSGQRTLRTIRSYCSLNPGIGEMASGRISGHSLNGFSDTPRFSVRLYVA